MISKKYTDSKYEFKFLALNGKKPKHKLSWEEASKIPILDHENYGVLLPDDILVIDVDKKFKGCDYDKLTNILLESIHYTLCVETTTGGFHFYYSKPREVKIQKILPEFRHIEFLSAGAYAVGIGSVLDGKEYKIHQDEDILEIPRFFLGFIEDTGRVIKKDTEDDFVYNYETAKENFKRYLVDIAPYAISGSGRDNTTYRTACVGKDFAIKENDCFELMRDQWNTDKCFPPLDLQRLRTKVENAYKYGKNEKGILSQGFSPISPQELQNIQATGIIETTGKGIQNNLKKIVEILRHPKVAFDKYLQFNEFSSDIELSEKIPILSGKNSDKWGDEEAILLKYYFSAERGINLSVNILHEAITVISKINTYHPVKDYILNLRWDGKNRVGRWLIDYCHAKDSKYVRAIGTKVLCAAIARVFMPGCKFDSMLVFEGKEFIGKSAVCKILGGKWSCDPVIDIGNKDTIDMMRGKWIIEMPEMEHNTRSEVQSMKAFLSREVDRVRLPYQRTTKEFPRQSIFIGTINPEADNQYLRSTTGNRRYWCVAVRDIKLDELSIDRDQLFAEAYIYYANKEVLFLDSKELFQEGVAEAKIREVRDSWAECIEDYLENNNICECTITELYEKAIGGKLQYFRRSEASRIANIVSKLGFYGTTIRREGRQKSGFRKEELRGLRVNDSIYEGDEI